MYKGDWDIPGAYLGNFPTSLGIPQEGVETIRKRTNTINVIGSELILTTGRGTRKQSTVLYEI